MAGVHRSNSQTGYSRRAAAVNAAVPAATASRTRVGVVGSAATVRARDSAAHPLRARSLCSRTTDKENRSSMRGRDGAGQLAAGADPLLLAGVLADSLARVIDTPPALQRIRRAVESSQHGVVHVMPLQPLQERQVRPRPQRKQSLPSSHDQRKQSPPSSQNQSKPSPLSSRDRSKLSPPLSHVQPKPLPEHRRQRFRTAPAHQGEGIDVHSGTGGKAVAVATRSAGIDDSKYTGPGTPTSAASSWSTSSDQASWPTLAMAQRWRMFRHASTYAWLLDYSALLAHPAAMHLPRPQLQPAHERLLEAAVFAPGYRLTFCMAADPRRGAVAVPAAAHADSDAVLAGVLRPVTPAMLASAALRSVRADAVRVSCVRYPPAGESRQDAVAVVPTVWMLVPSEHLLAPHGTQPASADGDAAIIETVQRVRQDVYAASPELGALADQHTILFGTPLGRLVQRSVITRNPHPDEPTGEW